MYQVANIDFPPPQLASMFPTTNDLVPDDLTVYILSVAVNFLSRVIFIFLLFLGTVMNANEVETKEK